MNPQTASQNLNISAFRLLYFFQILCSEQTVSLDKLNQYFCQHPLISRPMSLDTLQKYVQTLNMACCLVRRYDLGGETYFSVLLHPFQVQLSTEQAELCLGLLEALQNRFLRHLARQFSQLLRIRTNIAMFSERATTVDVKGSDLSGFRPDCLPPALQATIEKFQRYCDDGQVLEIRYQSSLAEQDVLATPQQIEPLRLHYEQKQLFLLGYDPRAGKQCRIPIRNIVSDRQLPSLIKRQKSTMLVNYRLSGRLARNYRPYPEETVTDKGDVLFVQHRADDLGALLNRLMKYGADCQLLGPSDVVSEFKRLIQRRLETLQTSEQVLARLSRTQMP